MTLFKMVKETITTRWVKAKCSECGQVFEYPKDSLYKPETCGRFDCELKRQHPELNRVRGGKC